ncbi:MAG TPA: hypothetical protein VFQ53_25070 [Kofleriaceae bacterium]|nr:hypothetical protein [Kofleriaceae bacterium]
MRSFLLALVLVVGCGNDKANPPDNPSPDAPNNNGSDAALPPITLDCASYCGAIQAACTGALAQYESMQTCLGTCEQFAVGTQNDTTGNTLGCRVYHTDFARQDAMTHCEHAGPSGGTMCGATIVEDFCSIAPTICPTQWSANQCGNRASNIPSMGPYSINSTGNTIECRLYHLTLATTDPTTHCPHTDVISTTCL